MNDILSKLQKTGVWLWNQKEKMVLLILLGVFGFRVYVVLNGQLDAEAVEKSGNGKEAATPSEVKDPELPPPRPALPRPAEYEGLVKRNPFTIYGIASGEGDQRSGNERIDLILNRIVPWSDGSNRAEILSTRDGKTRYYEEGEAFLDYRLVSIDPEGNSVVVYSSEYDKNFTLKAQGTS